MSYQIEVNADARARPYRPRCSRRAMKGSRTLGGAVRLLEIRCSKCDRYGRESIARLIERYGRQARLVDIRHQLAGDCQNREAGIHERCDVYFPQLAELQPRH